MHSWVLPWLIVTAVTTAAVLAISIVLVRDLLVLTRTIGRFREEVQPIVEDIAREGARAGDRVASLPDRAPGRSR